MKKFGLTSQQFNIMRILRGQHPNPANIKLLRERMLDKMSDASRIVEKLRTKGLIERNTNESDRRACDVIITQKGLELLKVIDKEDITFDGFFSQLDEQEMKHLNHLLDKLRGLVFNRIIFILFEIIFFPSLILSYIRRSGPWFEFN